MLLLIPLAVLLAEGCISVCTLLELSADCDLCVLQISFGPISWLMVGEIFPLAVRGQATALATLTNFGSNFGVRASTKLSTPGHVMTSDMQQPALCASYCVLTRRHLPSHEAQSSVGAGWIDG